MTRLSQYGGEADALLALMKADPALTHPIIPDLPYVMAEVAYACTHEMAMTLDDVLARRLHLGIEDWSHGADAAPAVAQVMARELGWSAAEAAARVETYRASTRQLA